MSEKKFIVGGVEVTESLAYELTKDLSDEQAIGQVFHAMVFTRLVSPKVYAPMEARQIIAGGLLVQNPAIHASSLAAQNRRAKE